MEHNFPNDVDGDTLRQLVKSGSNLSKPMTIDFQVAVPDEATAKGLASVLNKLGYRVRIYASPKCSLPWTCECSTRMIANYVGVIAIQEELTRLAEPFRGHPDGWGSFGNKTDEAQGAV